MAQRSARARVKLEKISSNSAPPQPPSPQHSRARQQQHYREQQAHGYSQGGTGVARLGSGGLLTPSASSVSGSSTRNSLQLPQAPRIHKGWRGFFDKQGENLKRLGSGHSHQRKDSDHTNFYAGLGGGLSSGSGLSALESIGEENVVVKRWEGSGGKGEIWDGGGKGKKDLELWYPDGDTLVYLTERPGPLRNPTGLYRPPMPQPSFRLRSSTLRETQSPFLIAQLEDSVEDTTRPTTPLSENPISPSEDGESVMEFEYQLTRPRTTQTEDSVEQGVQYRLYFPAPPRSDKTWKHRHHLTTRNFFALLFNKPLVGITLGQALLDLVERTDMYLSTSTGAYDVPEQSPLDAFNAVGIETPQSLRPTNSITHRLLLDYLQNREFDDVRNWPEGAAALVVWAEKAASPANGAFGLGPSEVSRIEALWKEGFVHCTGMLSNLEGASEWRELSPITKALIDRASLEIQVRVQQANARVNSFDFLDMWPTSSVVQPTAFIAFERFQKFLQKHYASRFGSWPPTEGTLTRTYYVVLQRDFAALYDFLVDREAIWGPPPTHALQPNQRRRIYKPINNIWRADDDELAVSDILSNFDTRHFYPHVPHPFPLIPATAVGPKLGHTVSITAQTQPPPNKRQQRFFASPSASSLRNRATSNPAAALALSESTNIEALCSTKTINPLVEAFMSHEKGVPASEVAPHDARKGRWILIYGMLQTLASVAVDAPGVRWSEGVEYFLNAKLKGTPPWKAPTNTVAEGEQDERSHWRSHCWTAGKNVQHSVSLPDFLTTAPIVSAPAGRGRVVDASHSRARSRSKGKERLRKQRTREKIEAEQARRDAWSGDEGDDEMEGDTPPPPSREEMDNGLNGLSGLSPSPTQSKDMQLPKRETSRETMKWDAASASSR